MNKMLLYILLLFVEGIWANLSNRIFFPGDKISSPANSKIGEPICRSTAMHGFCTEVEDYPTATIERLIKLESDLIQNQLKLVMPDRNNVSITQRTAMGEATEYLCESEISTLYPQSVTTTANKKVFIVNTEEYRQAIQVVKCKNNGGRCSLSSHFPNKYTNATCQQEFLTVQINGLDKDGKKLIPVLVDYPCCCRCAILKDDY